MRPLKARLSEKSDAQLLYYIKHVDKHTEEAVRLAYELLLERKIVLPPGTTEAIELGLVETKKAREVESNRPWPLPVDDPTVPLLYSQTAIYVFSVVVTPIIGSFMMASNLRTVGKRSWPVVLAAFVWTFGVGALMDWLNLTIRLTSHFMISAIGVVLMHEVVWNRQIGKEMKYRAKPIWKPLILALVLSAIIVFVLVRY